MDTKTKESPKSSKARKIVSWVQIATAIVSFLIIFIVTGLLNQAEGFNFWILLLAAMPFLYLAAGIGLLKKKKGFWILSVVLQCIAVLDFSIGDTLSWYWDPGLALAFSLNVGGSGFGIDFLAIAMVVLLLRIRKETTIQPDGGHNSGGSASTIVTP